jgi:MarR family
MPETTEQVRALLQSRLEEIRAETESLQRALTSLRAQAGGGDSAPRRSPRRSASNGRRAASSPKRVSAAASKPRSRRAAPGERQAQLLAQLKKAPGATSADLARAIGVAPSQASVLIAKAKARKLVVKRGGGYALKAS